MTCNDLRLGGTLSGTGISGGTSINSTALMVADWSQLLGSWGMSGQMQVVNGRWGGYISGDLLGRERYPTLNMAITPLAAGASSGFSDTQLQTNTDTFLELLTDPDGNYLEVDMPDGTSRFLFVYNLDAAPISQPRRFRTISAPLVSPYAYWKQGGDESTQTISGAANMIVEGNREVWDAVIEFSGDGTFTHNDLGWAIEVTGSGAAVTVDLGARTVTESGSPATNRIRRTPASGKGPIWGWFVAGTNSITTTVSCDVTWRPSYA